MRRKSLFYIVNLIIPCVGIFYLSMLAFYLPAQASIIVIITYESLHFQIININKSENNPIRKSKIKYFC